MSDTERVPTNLRLLMILEVIGKSEQPMTPTEVNRVLGLPKQTIHRLFDTLVSEGFLIREVDQNRFRPARRARLMGSGLLHASRASISRHQILERVARGTGETVNFVVPEENGMRYLDRVETDWPFRIQLPRGSHVPFHATASGKTFLASLSNAQRKRVVASLSLEKWTDNSITSADVLLKECKKIADQGFATDREEFIENMVAFAVPILDEGGRFIAALATHGPKNRIDSQDHNKLVQTLKTHAESLSI